MASYEYNKEDLPDIEPGEWRKLHDDSDYRIVQAGSWSMEYVDPPLPEDGDSILESVDETILAWIAYRNWLAENPPKRVRHDE